MIPGQPIGTQVDYYFAAQNEGATMIATLPSGGYGISPPGTTPPGDYFTYQVDYISTLFNCSETLPKPINDLTFLYDTIHISQDGTLDDLNVEIDITHTYCGDVEIYLVGPDGTQIDLCVGHGGSGNNFTGTILDDEADTPIAQGSPPFSGRYIPDEPLASFQNLSTIKGDWVLVVFDNALNDDGQLNNWCLDMQYLVGTDELEESKLTIHQNYPNPFSESTNFSFDLEEKSDIHISILDMMGREIQTVCSQEYPAGSHSVSWQAEGIPAGQYFYRVQSNDAITVKPMIIVK
jgi:subtilisin-like proprotein convertase family protein